MLCMLKIPSPGFNVPDFRRDGSFVLATSQFDSASGRDFSSSHLAAASLPISAESEMHQKWSVKTHTLFYTQLMTR